MKKIEHTTKDGDSIVIYDDLFDYTIRHKWFQALYNSALRFSISYDSQLSDYKSVSALGNLWNKDDWDNFGLPRHPNWKEVQSQLGDRSFRRGWLNINTGKELYRCIRIMKLRMQKAFCSIQTLNGNQNGTDKQHLKVEI